MVKSKNQRGTKIAVITQCKYLSPYFTQVITTGVNYIINKYFTPRTMLVKVDKALFTN